MIVAALPACFWHLMLRTILSWSYDSHFIPGESDNQRGDLPRLDSHSCKEAESRCELRPADLNPGLSLCRGASLTLGHSGDQMRTAATKPYEQKQKQRGRFHVCIYVLFLDQIRIPSKRDSDLVSLS